MSRSTSFVALLFGDRSIGAVLFGLLVALGTGGGGTGTLEIGAALEQELAQDTEGVGRPAANKSDKQVPGRALPTKRQAGRQGSLPYWSLATIFIPSMTW